MSQCRFDVIMTLFLRCVSAGRCHAKATFLTQEWLIVPGRMRSRVGQNWVARRRREPRQWQPAIKPANLVPELPLNKAHVMTSLWRQNNVTTSFWCHNDVIMWSQIPADPRSGAGPGIQLGLDLMIRWTLICSWPDDMSKQTDLNLFFEEAESRTTTVAISTHCQSMVSTSETA